MPVDPFGKMYNCGYTIIVDPEGTIIGMPRSCEYAPDSSGLEEDPDAPKTPCDAAIWDYANTFAKMAKDLGTKPEFIMAIALQESGWDMVHVFETNSSSNNQPLNNLFGETNAGGNNLAFSSIDASAQHWEQNWGGYLKDKPQTIDAFVSDLLSNPNHMYNSHADWPIAVKGGTWTTDVYSKKGDHTIGTYASVLKWTKLCKKSF